MSKRPPNYKDDEIKIDGKKEAAELLRGLDESSRERILRDIATKDPALENLLRKGMVNFNQVLSLSPADFQKVIHSQPPKLLALAARGLADEESEKLFSKLSQRQGVALKEEMLAIGPQKLSDVKLAREKIIERARELHEKKEIILK